jgi:hypothetical protein
MNASPRRRHRRIVLAAAVTFLTFLSAGCGSNPGVEAAQRTVDALQGCVDLLKSVSDDASARVAANQITPVFGELIEALEASIAYEKANGMVRGSSGQINALQADLQRLQSELAQESGRIDDQAGLPAEFWTPYRRESFRMLRVTLTAGGPGAAMTDPATVSAIEQLSALCEQHGAERLIELTLVNDGGGDVQAAVQRLREIAGPDVQVVDFANPESPDEQLIGLSPVEDFDKFIASLDIGAVVDQEKARCEATVQLTSVAPPASLESPEATQLDSEFGRDGMAADESGTMTSNVDGSQQLLMLVAGGMEFATKLSGFVPRGAPGEPMFYHPNYHAQLAEHLFDAQSPFHEKAVLTLLNVPPQKVADKQVRGRIAQGYRGIAFSEGSTHAASAVRGLVVWGGKYSAPLLVELLEKTSAGGAEIEAALYEGLGTLATPECAAAVVARLGSATSAPAASECLERMGTVAEEPLIAALPFESAEANLAAIKLLANCGTRKCNTILRMATKSENEDVATAALDAIRKIRDRDRQMTSAK